jgi:hypothetical protein
MVNVKKGKMRHKVLFAILAILTLACSKNKKTVNQPCGETVVINQTTYNNTSTDRYIITNAVITGDCLEITFGSSGCNANNWVADLVDSGAILDSNPVQRMIKLSLTNNELCAAAFVKSLQFDITGLRVSGSSSVRLMLTGFGTSLIYQY